VSPAPLFEISGLEVRYGHVEAVRGVSLQVDAGEVVTLIGPNGAGKSSTLGAVAGLVRPAAGEVRLAGRRMTGCASHQAVAAGIVLVPEGRAVLTRLTVEENLRLAAEARPHPDPWKARLEAVCRRFPVLTARRPALAGTLSGGEQQMLAIARALLAQPRILLLDEPSMGLAPQMVEEVFRLVGSIREGGTPVLLVEQNARMALGISDRAYVLERGQVVLQGTGAELAADRRVQAAYLGGDVET
jgi:branched-chain amino acid transport system ATP-binding protein